MSLSERRTRPDQDIPENNIDCLVLEVFKGKSITRLELSPDWNPDRRDPWQDVNDWGVRVQEFLGTRKENVQSVSKVVIERRYCAMTYYSKYNMILMLGSGYHLNWVWLEHWDDGQTTISFHSAIHEREKQQGTEEAKRA